MAVAEEDRSSYIANCILNVLLCCTATMLNSVTIIAIRKTSSLSKTLKKLLLSLAVSDLCVGLLVQPLYIAHLALEWEQNTENDAAHVMSKAFVILGFFFSSASYFGVTALSADRFLAIHLHFRYQELVTHKRVVGVVTAIWLFSIFLSLVWLPRWTPWNISHVIVVIIDVACLITVSLLSYKIYMVIRQHQQHIQALQVQQLAQNVAMANVGRLRKSAVTAIYVCLMFVLCCLPFICILWTIAITRSTSEPLITIIQHYTRTLVFLNSSLNPLIYCWKMRGIRHNIRNILRNVFSRQN